MPAFTRDGIECLQQIIADKKVAGRALPQIDRIAPPCMQTVLTGKPNRRAEGRISFRTSSRFASSSEISMLTPVMLRPGRAMLSMNPDATMSFTLAKMGIVGVARCAPAPPAGWRRSCWVISA